jgi:intracellular septation protein A
MVQAAGADGVKSSAIFACDGRRQLVAKTAAKAVPSLILASVVPAACFLLGQRMWGLIGAIGLALAWNCLYQVSRWFRGRPLSTLVVLGLFEMIFRGTVSMALHSAQLFFIAPAIVTAGTAVLFVGSGFWSKPLLARVVGDLVPDSVLDLRDPRVTRMLRRVSVFYGAEQFVVAVISVAMVLNMSTSAYVATHTLVSWLVLGVAAAAAAPFLRPEMQAVIRSVSPAQAAGDSGLRSRDPRLDAMTESWKHSPPVRADGPRPLPVIP